MTTKHVLGITNTSTCNQNLHREVRQNFSQRTLNYEVTPASSFWLSLTHKEKLMSDISQVPAWWGGCSFPCHTQSIHSKGSAPQNSGSAGSAPEPVPSATESLRGLAHTGQGRRKDLHIPPLSLCKSLSKPYHRRLLMGYFVIAHSLSCLL